MKRDVANLGNSGDVVKVKRGYARNFLIPKGIGVEAGPEAFRQFDLERKKLARLAREELEELTKMGAEIEGLSVTVEARANEDGTLFGSVSADEIAEAVNGVGYKIDGRAVKLEEPLKELGIFPVKVRLTPDVVSEIKVWVIEERSEIGEQE